MRLLGELGKDQALETIEWQSWSPTVSSASGSFSGTTVHEARYQEFGKIVHYFVDVEITNVGSASGDVRVGLPINSVSNHVGTGRSVGTHAGAGNQLQGMTVSSTLLVIWNYTGGFPGATGARLRVGGFYEIS